MNWPNICDMICDMPTQQLLQHCRSNNIQLIKMAAIWSQCKNNGWSLIQNEAKQSKEVSACGVTAGVGWGVVAIGSLPSMDGFVNNYSVG